MRIESFACVSPENASFPVGLTILIAIVIAALAAGLVVLRRVLLRSQD